MMLYSLIFVSLLSFSVSPVYGLISIKSQPAKVANNGLVRLVCDVGTMENTVKWVYDGVTYFSCDPPFTNCFTNSSSTREGFYDFSINETSLIAIVLVEKDQNDGIWSCYHGNDEADIDIDNADAPQITSLRDSYCEIKSQLPADVVIYTQNYLGLRKLYEKNHTNIARHTFTKSLLCADSKIFCNVSNGYGPTITGPRSVHVDCPVKILYNWIPNTTFTFDKTGIRLTLKIYYEGYPYPSASLSRITTDGFQEVQSGYISIYPYLSVLMKPRYTRIDFRLIKISDAGKYVLTLKQATDAARILFTLVYTGEETTTRFNQLTATTTTPLPTSTKGSPLPTATRGSPLPTATRGSPLPTATRGSPLPTATIGSPSPITTRGSPLPTTTATSTPITTPTTSMGNMFENKMKNEISIMDYLGVTGFVISLLLVTMVIVGVFWINRMKKKLTGSKDKVYSTTLQSTNNIPNHIYDNLNID